MSACCAGESQLQTRPECHARKNASTHICMHVRYTHERTIAKRASDDMTQTRLRQTNWNGGWFSRLLKGQKPLFLKHLWNENFAYIPCISLRTRLCWLSLAGISVICILFLDFVRFAIRVCKVSFSSHRRCEIALLYFLNVDFISLDFFCSHRDLVKGLWFFLDSALYWHW